ncbi:MAG: hypothetical protein ACI9KE_000270 [Polyangiales bacterium]|jgi:hypothetical protein
MRYRIDEPCNEDWDSMEVHEDGRFCQSCQHSVVDATKMTKREFEAFYNDANGDVCVQVRANPAGHGIFRRDLVKPRPLGSFVLLSTLLASACAIEAPAEPVGIPLVDPGSQLVDDKKPVGLPFSPPDASMDSGVDASMDSGVHVVDRATRLGRIRRH